MNYSELTKRHELLIKYEGNPILKPSDWPYRVNAVFNPGATRFQNRTLLMVRVEGMDGFSHLTAARSENGRSDWIIDPIPTLLPDPAQHPEEAWGIEDPRITYLQELDMYGMVYTAFSKRGPVISMALTRDFSHFERKGVVMLSEDKDAALFPRRIGGRWVLVHRPVESVIVGGAHIWLSFSPDLKYWGDSIMVLETREGGWWDSYKIGLGPQPIETSEGWLIIYHGVRKTASGSLYRVGYALMDLDDPSKLIYRGNEWILGPTENYERVGDVPGVTFPCGAVYDETTDMLDIYYGSADTSIGLATMKLQDLLDLIKKGSGSSIQG